jgi:hypothetical protein
MLTSANASLLEDAKQLAELCGIGSSSVIEVHSRHSLDPERIITKGGARVGDVLVLSKPLGFGVTTTALPRQQADPERVAEVVDWMKRTGPPPGGLEAGVRGADSDRLQPAWA